MMSLAPKTLPQQTPPQRITPVILSGGSGTRLWPASRADRPKQFLCLTDDSRSMLQLTAARCADSARFSAPLIIAGHDHLTVIADQLAALSDYRIVAEPMGRNTAPALALAALALPDDDALMLVMPSDHAIADEAAFQSAIDSAARLARQGQLVTFGVEPTHPETGYGYIEMGAPLDGGYHVARFVEKPVKAKAEAMLSAGGFVWNAGLFLFSRRTLLDALDQYEPDILSACNTAMKVARDGGNILYPDADAFGQSPAISIDYAVMERADNVAVVPVDMGWSDIGSWQALHDRATQDADGNALSGDVLMVDARNNLVRADDKRVSIIGLEGYAVIVEGDDIVITPLARSQDVRQLAEKRDDPLRAQSPAK